MLIYAVCCAIVLIILCALILADFAAHFSNKITKFILKLKVT